MSWWSLGQLTGPDPGSGQRGDTPSETLLLYACVRACVCVCVYGEVQTQPAVPRQPSSRLILFIFPEQRSVVNILTVAASWCGEDHQSFSRGTGPQEPGPCTTARQSHLTPSFWHKNGLFHTLSMRLGPGLNAARIRVYQMPKRTGAGSARTTV